MHAWRHAGDDVDRKKPDPTIYRVAAERLGVAPAECVVVEDSLIGLQAARGAGMRCIITYTPSTRKQVGGWAEAGQRKLACPSQGPYLQANAAAAPIPAHDPALCLHWPKRNQM
jgi:beta-phosphoglucomutase-like phosphatase (HAD superfamily)